MKTHIDKLKMPKIHSDELPSNTDEIIGKPLEDYINGYKTRKAEESILYTEELLIGNCENSLDEFLLNSPSHTQEERELIVDAVSCWINNMKNR
jgi:hypothetical protein